MDLPIGRSEDERTEFKRGDALRNPITIAREVVGFLNADGGDVWIGVEERDGIAVAVEPIPETAKEISRLQDVLVDRIEPSPPVGSVLRFEVEAFPDDPGKSVLRIRVAPGTEGPYALLDQGARRYVRRTGSRLLPMTREELARAFRSRGTPDGGPGETDQWVMDRMRKGGEKFAGLRVVVRPVEDLGLELVTAELEPLLRVPQRSGNRRHGWNFTDERGVLQRFHEGGAEAGFRLGGADSYQRTWVLRCGAIEFQARMERLHWKGPENALWPYALLEFPASVARLAVAVYQRAARKPTQVVLGLGLLGIRGQTLKPHSPMAIGYLMHEAQKFDQADDFVANPVRATWQELRDAPDRCAFRLVRQVYEAFGYGEEEIPKEYDGSRGLLTFQG